MLRPRQTCPESRSARAARCALPSVLLFVLGSSLLLDGPAAAQLLLLPEDSGPRSFPISRLELVYASPRADQPSLDAIVPVRVELRETETGWAAPRSGQQTQSIEIGGPHSPVIRLEPSGLAVTLRALVAAIHETGLYGVDVRPAARDIDLASERDLRPPDRDSLEIVVTVGRIDQVRTIAVGDRIKGDWRIDHELHNRIRETSPLQPTESSVDDATDLVDRRALEDYLFRLNRHAGRRVEAALSPAEEPGRVVLDYRVFESRPWFVYGQVSNTGTERTSDWQTRAGVVHRQLTNRDDIFSLEYLNGGKDVNGMKAQYQAPFFGPKRPDWMNRRKGDPGWINWLPRDAMPWWGVDRLRWEADISYGRYKAGQSSDSVIFEDTVVSEQIQSSGRFIYEAWQHHDFFLDLWAGLRIRHLKVDNKTNAVTGEDTLVLPRIGLHGERINSVSNLRLDVGAEGQVRNTRSAEIERFGRQDVDGKYATIDFNFGYSTYLEPLLFPKAWSDPESRRSSTLAHEIAIGARGQYAFNYRLIPQASQIVGGLYSVRGFQQSEAAGDSVFVGSIEYRFHVPRVLPIMRTPLELPLLGDFRVTPQQVYGRPDWDLIFRAFLDVGRAIRNANNVGPDGFEPDDTLIGMGIGAELQFRSNLRARIDWATPLTATSDEPDNSVQPGDKSEVHLLFSILF
jgi:hemolysin activation/secretion protein